MICDSHAHLNHAKVFDEDREQVVARAAAAGVTVILNVATSQADAAATVASARQHSGMLAAVGIHPHEAAGATDAAMVALENLAAAPEVVAWGEIGLDFHYLHAPRQTQLRSFARQLETASRLSLPVSVHTRQADDDTVALLRQHAGPSAGVIHCFTGDWALARACLDLGFLLSFSGIVTFRNADALRQVACKVPASSLLVETDSPYLAPAPRRGGRNEPARALDVAEHLAGIRGESLEDLARVTTANFQRLFGAPITTAASSLPPPTA